VEAAAGVGVPFIGSGRARRVASNAGDSIPDRFEEQKGEGSRWVPS
jgi:hypothetical protein